MDLISLVRGSFASDSSSISHFDVVNDQLVLAVSQVLDLESWVIRVDLLSVHVEVSWSGWVLELNIENDLLPLDTLFEVSHPLLEAVVIGNLQWSSGLITDGLGGDLGRVIQLTVLDDQLPFLTLGNDLNPLAVRNDLHPVLPPSHGSVIFFYSPVSPSSADRISKVHTPPSFLIKNLVSLPLISLPSLYHRTLASGLSTLHFRFTFLPVLPFLSCSPFAMPYTGSAGSTSK